MKIENYLLPKEKLLLKAKFCSGLRQLMLTDIRIVYIKSSTFLANDFFDLPIKRLESVDVIQGFGGKLFDYGTLSIRGVGGKAIKIPYVRDPHWFKTKAMERVYYD